jgi:hypothetical protein
MAVILPERTVDAWTAAYVTGRRWRARLWAPSERAPGERYDLAVGLGALGGLAGHGHREPWPDKVFVLEHKGVDVDRRGRARLWIRVRQLLDHLAADRAAGGGLVHYVLPDPGWNRRQPAPYGTVPVVAQQRTRGAGWAGFQRWAAVAPAASLLAHLRALHAGDPARFRYVPPGAGRPDDWLCALWTTEVWTLDERLPLRDFLTAVHDCARGRLVGDLPAPAAVPAPPAGREPWSFGRSHRRLALVLAGEAVGRDDTASPTAHDGDDDVADLPPDVLAFRDTTTYYGVGDADADTDRRSAREPAPPAEEPQRLF